MRPRCCLRPVTTRSPRARRTLNPNPTPYPYPLPLALPLALALIPTLTLTLTLTLTQARRLPSLLFSSAPAAAPAAAPVDPHAAREPASFAALLNIKLGVVDESNDDDDDNNDVGSAADVDAPRTFSRRLWVKGLGGALGKYEYGSTRGLSGGSPWSTARSHWSARALGAAPTV